MSNTVSTQSEQAVASSSGASQRRAPSVTHITVCICTYRRPDLLARLLGELERQQTEDRFTFSVVVCDNDRTSSAREVALAFAERTNIPLTYDTQPEKNIALTRNRALTHATGDYVAFIDDDEFPAPQWLSALLATCSKFGASGVLGPVRPHFDTPPPAWVIKGRFCERHEPATGTIMPWNRSRTGNLLFRREIIDGLSQPFDPAFGTGGEDVDFFRRMSAKGCRFVWCNEAVAHESVPPARWTRGYMLRRALLRGRNNLKLRGGRARMLGVSCVAVPLYSLILPVTLPFGQHVFMKYCIRLCDHLGRLLSVVGLNPVSER